MKPTAFVFFSIEIALWFAVIVYVVWTNADPLAVLFLKISIVNIAVASLNLIGAAVSSAIDWYPFR